MAQPDYNALIDAIWGGSSVDSTGLLPFLLDAANLVSGTNPLYSATDFFAIYPAFGGVPAAVVGGLVTGSAAVTAPAVPDGAQILFGQYISGPGIPSGATVAAYVPAAGGNPAVLTLSTPATATGSPVGISVYTAPLIPAAVLNLYISLASSSIMQARWFELWPIGMALYIAHYCTLWAQANGNPATTAGQLAVAGAARGILTSKSADGLSVGYTPLDFAGWGSYALTTYGQQFATYARAIGSGAMYLY